MKVHDRQATPLLNALLEAGVVSPRQAKAVLMHLQKNIDRKEEDILAGIYTKIIEMEEAQTSSIPAQEGAVKPQLAQPVPGMPPVVPPAPPANTPLTPRVPAVKPTVPNPATSEEDKNDTNKS